MTLVSSALFLSACGGNDKPDPEPEPEKTLKVTPETLEIPGIGGTKTFEVKATEMWLAESSETWCKISKSQGISDDVLTVTVTEENPKSDASRPATITIKTTKETATVTVTQLAGPVKPLDDRGRLMQLFDAAGGANWINKDNWGSDKPLWEWAGITMNETDDTMIDKIELIDNNLKGTIPAAICDITSLTVLNLGFDPENTAKKGRNALTGEIPTNIGNLSNLVYLNLSGNKLTGGIPTSIGNISALYTLALHENQLTGSLPSEICDLAGLAYLSVNTNKLSGDLPSNLGNMVAMNTLSLYENEFTGSIPASIGKMQQMVYFSTWTCKMSGPIPAEIGNCTMLESLWLFGNKHDGQIPASIGNLKNLVNLYIRENDFSGTIPKELGNCTKLANCELGVNPKLTGSIPAELGNLRNLEYLYLKECNLVGDIPLGLFAPGSKLNKLNIRMNNLTGSIPASIDNAPLQEAYLYGNKLNGTVPAGLLTKVNANKTKFVLTPQQSGFTFDNLAN